MAVKPKPFPCQLTIVGLLRKYCLAKGRRLDRVVREIKGPFELAFGNLGTVKVIALFSQDEARRAGEVIRQHYAPKTAIWARRMYLNLWEFAFANELVHSRPNVDSWVCDKKIRKVPRAWTKDEVQRMFEAAESSPLLNEFDRRRASALLCLLYFTAARRKHILGLKREDFNPDGDPPTVKIVDTKTRQEKVFQLPPLVAQTIKAAMTTNPYHARFEYVYPKPSVRRLIEAVMHSAGVKAHEPGMFIHAWRKAAATHIAATAGVAAAAEHLGHSSIDMTIKHYIDPRQIAVHSHCDALDSHIMLGKRD